MDNDLEIKEKFKLIDKLLGGDHLFIHIDTRREGVSVPVVHAGSYDLTLKLSMLFRGKVELLNDRVEAELLFDEGYETCIVPLSAIWGVTDESGKSRIWPHSAPEEVMAELLEGNLEGSSEERVDQQSGVGAQSAPTQESTEKTPLREVKRPKLTRVK